MNYLKTQLIHLIKHPLLFTLPVVLVFSIILIGCAAQGPPGGGPVDKTGPTLISTLPENRSINVDKNCIVEFIFSESIDPRSAEGALIITPKPDKPPNVKVSRRKITVDLYEPLLENTTYILSFGRNIKDYRKNQTAGDIKLAFSTGDSLDDGIISGKVYKIPEKLNAAVWVYRKHGAFPDSLLGSEPDYIAAVDEFGYYNVTNLPVSEYRLISVSSQLISTFFLTEDDFIGLPQKDPLIIKHRQYKIKDINFRLGKLYLKPFRLFAVNTVEGCLELNFSHQILENSIQNANYIWSKNADMEILSSWIHEKEPNIIRLKIQGLIEGETYEVSVENILDSNDDEISISVNPVKFIWHEQVDTTGPKLLKSRPTNREKGVPLDSEIRLDFSEPIKIENIKNSVSLWKRDTLKIPFDLEWIDGNSLILKTLKPLESANHYRLDAVTYSWKDYDENSFVDSTLTIRFSTVNVDTFGSITGSVISNKNIDFRKIFLECVLTSRREFIKGTHPDSLGFYKLINLLPGKYIFNIWEDKNGNNRYDCGKLIPFQIAEPFKAYPDIINVRSRWETAEVELAY